MWQKPKYVIMLPGTFYQEHLMEYRPFELVEYLVWFTVAGIPSRLNATSLA